MLFVRYSRPRNGVVPVGVPRRQLLAIQHDVVLELLLDDDGHRVVENNCLVGNENSMRILSVRLSVCLSVKRVDYDKT